MTNEQRIAVQLSETRSRLNEIAGLDGDDFTPEIREEGETLQREYADLGIPAPRSDHRPGRSRGHSRAARCGNPRAHGATASGQPNALS